ncbi:transcriptional regulator GlxA family with amidase domain [Breoghania corrubedonensis]|uniref:Transcriptional regulator GlxA family with amidase domain n=1 Tax=Breoghania corrubedonensis TaxID=665038 RepID=A0A2T5USE1_9HYPH|nr:helix-turn-helix domain-containing protein [Breoghania corrubedonensis]PTW54371.1 transcriptional regulator GlxA family with amidase domain [Breoghania corrubedonensis]
MKATFFLLDGFSNLVLSCLLEPLRMLHDLYQEEIEWRVVTADDQPVASSSNLLLAPTGRLDEIDGSDLLVIISSNGYRQHPTPENQRLVMSLVRQSSIVIGADAGAWLLAATGLLDDTRATLHWAVLAEFAETFPQVQVCHDNYVMEGRFWSCGGASTALELVLAFITERFGAAKSFMASSMFMSDTSLQKEGDRAPTALTMPHRSRLDAIKNIMVETIEHPLTLIALAQRAHLSPRTVNRLFKAELGTSPGHYYQQLRLSFARELADNTSLGLREIALRSGYSDAAALSKAFKRVYGYPVRKLQKSAQNTG